MELKTAVEDQTNGRGGIPTVWDRIREETVAHKDHTEHVHQGMNYWDMMRKVLRLMFNENNEKKTDFGTTAWEAHLAYRMGYERALQDVYKILPRPKE